MSVGEREGKKPEGHPNTVRETLAVMSSYRQTVETVSLVTVTFEIEVK